MSVPLNQMCFYIQVSYYKQCSNYTVFELYHGLWGSPLVFKVFFMGGGVPQNRTYNDLQRYITATSVYTTCFMQALYRINRYTGFTLLYFIDTNV